MVRSPQRRSSRAYRTIRLELLENRLPLATFNPLPGTADGAAGSLRAAITTANSNNQSDTINLKVGTYQLSLANVVGQENLNATGDLDLREANRTITIQGMGAGFTFIDADDLDRIFHVHPGVTLILKKLTIQDGTAVDDGTTGADADDGEARGGGILINNANVKLEGVLLRDNRAQGADGADGDTVVGAGDGLGAAGGGIFANLSAGKSLQFVG